jgi:hypothetical protein
MQKPLDPHPNPYPPNDIYIVFHRIIMTVVNYYLIKLMMTFGIALLNQYLLQHALLIGT